ncbi:MAG TPA: hypothetical protein D7H87_02700 [Candidatus Poseidoniales archaeon]|nr:MAG TPA: hypothetical protein D7H87_02700 [Candidatus Poseidoniales archaeon]
MICLEIGLYSLGIVLGFSIVRWFTETIKFHVRTNRLWLHHWIIALIVMLPLFYFELDYPLIWGGLTGAALEGLGRKNWSIRRK